MAATSHKVALIQKFELTEEHQLLYLNYKLNLLDVDIAVVFGTQWKGEREHWMGHLSSVKREVNRYSGFFSDDGCAILINTNYVISTRELLLKPNIEMIKMETRSGVLYLVAVDPPQEDGKGSLIEFNRSLNEVLKGIPHDSQLLLFMSGSILGGREFNGSYNFSNSEITERSLENVENSNTIVMTVVHGNVVENGLEEWKVDQEGFVTNMGSQIVCSHFPLDLLHQPQNVYPDRILSVLKESSPDSEHIRKLFRNQIVHSVSGWNPDYTEENWLKFQEIIGNAVQHIPLRNNDFSFEEIHKLCERMESEREGQEPFQEYVDAVKKHISMGISKKLERMCSATRTSHSPEQDIIKLERLLTNTPSSQTILQMSGCEGRFHIGAQCREQWKSIFNSRLRRENAEDNDGGEKPREISKLLLPTESDLRKAIGHLKSDKANIAYIGKECLECLPDEAMTILLGFHQHAWVHGAFPSWRRSMMYPILKKPVPGIAENYRGISHQHPCRKITERMIFDKTYSLLSESMGPETMNGNLMTTWAIRRVIEMADYKGKKLFVAFLDIENAYDNVNRRNLMDILIRRGLPRHCVSVLEDTYRDNVAYVHTINGVSDTFQTTTGIAQGGVMSPTLFNIVVDEIMKQADVGTGIPIGTGYISNIRCGDEIILFQEDMGRLQSHLDKVVLECAVYGLRLNPSKCRLLTKEKTNELLRVVDVDVESSEGVPFLGSFINASLQAEVDMSQRVAHVKDISRDLKSFSQKFDLHPQLVLKIYERFLRHFMLYGTATWTVSNKLLSILNRTEREMLDLLLEGADGLSEFEDVFKYVGKLRQNDDGRPHHLPHSRKTIKLDRVRILKSIVTDRTQENSFASLCRRILQETTTIVSNGTNNTFLWIVTVKNDLKDCARLHPALNQKQTSSWFHSLQYISDDSWKKIEEQVKRQKDMVCPKKGADRKRIG